MEPTVVSPSNVAVSFADRPVIEDHADSALSNGDMSCMYKRVRRATVIAVSVKSMAGLRGYLLG